MTMPATVIVMKPINTVVNGEMMKFYPGQKIAKVSFPDFSKVWDQYHTTFEVMEYQSGTYLNAAIAQVEVERARGHHDQKDHAIMIALATLRDWDLQDRLLTFERRKRKWLEINNQIQCSHNKCKRI